MASSTGVYDRSTGTIRTAACVIIQDEVLGGKTRDTNSEYFAKFCFSLGIKLKHIEVVADESEIIETTRRMSERYDFVVASGGIGPTHEDITYSSIAKGFNLNLVLHEGAFVRMKSLSEPHPSYPDFSWNILSPRLEAKLHMINLPIDPARDIDSQVLFVDDKLWVPISVVNGNIYILPGNPKLFIQLLDGLKPLILPRLADLEGRGVHRIVISTPMGESAVAQYVTELAARVESKGVRVGYDPPLGSNIALTLEGRDIVYLDKLVAEVEKDVDGERATPMNARSLFCVM